MKQLGFFVKEDISELAKSDFEIPVRIRKGSWEALIPDTIGKWIMTGAGIAATTYVTTAAKKLAENDFKDASLTKAFSKALQCIQWFIIIGKHLGTVTQKKFTNLRWQNENREVGIPNSNNEYLFVPSSMLNLFVICNPKMLAGTLNVYLYYKFQKERQEQLSPRFKMFLLAHLNFALCAVVFLFIFFVTT